MKAGRCEGYFSFHKRLYMYGDIFLMNKSIVLKQIDGDIYITLPIICLVCDNEGVSFKEQLDSILKRENLSPCWNEKGNYLEKILEYHHIAEGLFNTKKIGILYFVNDSEPGVPLGDYRAKKGDKIEIVYIGISDS